MNGFTVTELKAPGFFSRLLGRKLKAKALREIQNFWALRQRGAFVVIIDCGRFVE